MELWQNLIENSLKYHGDKTPVININATEKENHWCFKIKDNGIGIENKYYNKIFKIFQRLHNKDEYPGTGVGLAICKKIVNFHGGEIWVESEYGKSTTFYCTLPKIID